MDNRFYTYQQSTFENFTLNIFFQKTGGDSSKNSKLDV